MIGVAIDYSVFPDLDTLPTDFSTIQAKADFIARICGAWDFGVIPTRETFALLRSWQDAFDAFPRCRVAGVRRLSILVPLAGSSPVAALQADYERVDEHDGRREDPCRDLV